MSKKFNLDEFATEGEDTSPASSSSSFDLDMFDIDPHDQSSSSSTSDKTKVINNYEDIQKKMHGQSIKEALANAYKGYQAQYGNMADEDVPYMMPRTAFKDYVNNLITIGTEFKDNNGNVVDITPEDLTNDLSTMGSDILSIPGRALAAGTDEVFSGTDISGTRSMANVKAEDPLFMQQVNKNVDANGNIVETQAPYMIDESPRNLPSNILQTILRDKALIPSSAGTMGLGKVLNAGKGLAVANKLASIPKVGGIAKYLPQALGETAMYEGSSNLLDSDADPYNTTAGNATADVGANLLLSTLLGGALGKVAKNKWGTELAQVTKKLDNKAAKQKILDDTYDAVKGKGILEYDVPSTIDELGNNISKLGKEKEQLFTGLDKYIENIKIPESDKEILAKKLYYDTPDAYTDMFNTLDPTLIPTENAIKSGVTSAKSNLLDDVLNYNEIISDGAEKDKLIDVFVDTYLKRRKLNPEGEVETIKSLHPDLDDTGTYLTNLTDLFNSRKSVDQANKRAMAKLGTDKRLINNEDVAVTGRNIMNNAMDTKVNLISNLLKDSDAKEAKKTFKSVQALHNLYKTKDALQTIGGGTGNFARATPKRMGDGINRLKEIVLPSSGIRERQVSDIIESPFGRTLLNSLLQNNNSIGEE